MKSSTNHWQDPPRVGPSPMSRDRRPPAGGRSSAAGPTTSTLVKCRRACLHRENKRLKSPLTENPQFSGNSQRIRRPISAVNGMHANASYKKFVW